MTSTTEGVLPDAELPPILTADLAGPPFAPRGWVWTIAPAYAGLFVWEPLHDRLGTCLSDKTSFGWLAASSVLAMIACYILLYLAPALSGWAARRRLSVVGASAFGTIGSEWITGVAVAFGAIGFHAVSVYMSLRLTLLGLIALGLVPPSVLDRMNAGPFVLEGPMVLASALFWLFITVSANGLRLTGVIVALMLVYTPVALMLLGLTTVLACSRYSSPAVATQIAAAAGQSAPGVSGWPNLFQILFAGFALAGLSAVDWGMVVRRRPDVRVGGWISIIVAGSYCAILSLLTVRVAVGRTGAIDGTRARIADPLTFHGAIFHGIGGYAGGVILMLFGLAALAPSVFAVFTYSTRLGLHWPGIGRRGWAWLGAGLAFALIATTLASRVESTFGVMGAVFAPAVGVMTADFLRHRGARRRIYGRVNPSGLIGWGAGCLVGLVPTVGAVLGWREAIDFQPAALFAYLVAAVASMSLATLGFEGRCTVSLREADALQGAGARDGDAHRPDPSFPPGPDFGMRQASRGPGAN